jgi:predicted negative regulator of RcsB-dependent stress response
LDTKVSTSGKDLNSRFKLVRRVTQREEPMTDVSADQTHLDADVAALSVGLSAVEAEVAALKAAQPHVDFTALDAAVARLQSDVPAPAPAAAAEPSPPAA